MRSRSLLRRSNTSPTVSCRTPRCASLRSSCRDDADYRAEKQFACGQGESVRENTPSPQVPQARVERTANERGRGAMLKTVPTLLLIATALAGQSCSEGGRVSEQATSSAA